MSKNFRMKESFVKYLAGVIDADGCLSFTFNPTVSGKFTVGLSLSIQQSIAIDRNWKMLKTIHKETNVGNFMELRRPSDPERNPMAQWLVRKRSSFETLLPRIIKHSVIKAKHFQHLLDCFRQLKGKQINSYRMKRLKRFSQRSRLYSAPIKAKKHPTWAWAAGYLDGDGSFINKYYPKNYQHLMRVQVTCHENDRVAIDLLKKAFKGGIHNHGTPHILHWKRNLGFNDYSFVIRFLPKLINYSIIKKYKMEQILAVHNQRRQQRLIEKTLKGEDTVQNK